MNSVQESRLEDLRKIVEIGLFENLPPEEVAAISDYVKDVNFSEVVDLDTLSVELSAIKRNIHLGKIEDIRDRIDRMYDVVYEGYLRLNAGSKLLRSTYGMRDCSLICEACENSSKRILNYLLEVGQALASDYPKISGDTK